MCWARGLRPPDQGETKKNVKTRFEKPRMGTNAEGMKNLVRTSRGDSEGRARMSSLENSRLTKVTVLTQEETTLVEARTKDSNKPRKRGQSGRIKLQIGKIQPPRYRRLLPQRRVEGKPEGEKARRNYRKGKKLDIQKGNLIYVNALSPVKTERSRGGGGGGGGGETQKRQC